MKINVLKARYALTLVVFALGSAALLVAYHEYFQSLPLFMQALLIASTVPAGFWLIRKDRALNEME